MASESRALEFDAPAWWIDRFWARSKRAGDCREWVGARLPNGYGVYCTKLLKVGPRQYAHRIAYVLAHGPIPAGMFVCHHCDNPSCVEPTHLYLGTPKDNSNDAQRKGRMRGQFKPRLTADMVREMRATYATGTVTFFDLADRYGITFQHAHSVVRRRCWNHV
jgi:hypothetical protein